MPGEGPVTIGSRAHASASRTSSRRSANGRDGPKLPGFQRPTRISRPRNTEPWPSSGVSGSQLNVKDKAWDFKTREAFVAFSRATFVEWTRHLPESEWQFFITEILDHYQSVAANRPHEANTFKFYQMEVVVMQASQSIEL